MSGFGANAFFNEILKRLPVGADPASSLWDGDTLADVLGNIVGSHITCEANSNGTGYWYTFRNSLGVELFTIQRMTTTSSSGGTVTRALPIAFSGGGAQDWHCAAVQTNSVVIGIACINAAWNSQFQLRVVDGFNRLSTRQIRLLAIGKIEP